MNTTTEPPIRQDLSTEDNGKRFGIQKQRASIWDALWLLVLTVYIMAGIVTVPFHGDEAMQITMSRDYFTAFVDHQPQALTVTPPYSVDTPSWLRLINGSINLYTIGLSLQVAGYGEKDLPPVWVWPISYDDNVTQGNRPSQGILVASRISSTLFLAASAAILFAIGWQFRGRWAAYIASGLYAINPVILINGRRAMMEGSVLCFGLLAILIAILICKGRSHWRWWIALGLASGLTLASKHSGIVFIAAAFGWVMIAEIQNHLYCQVAQNTKIFSPLARLGLSFVIMGGVFIALSPAQWNNPVARFEDLVTERAKLLDSQVTADPNGATPISDRIRGIFTQPYIDTPVYFEAAFWGGAKTIQDEIAVYDGSMWSGLHAGTIIGGLLTLLAMIGSASLFQQWRTWQIGMLLWLGITITSLLVNPLPWQRYYLAVYPLTALLTAVGALVIFDRFRRQQSPF